MTSIIKLEFIENVLQCWKVRATIGMAIYRTFNVEFDEYPQTDKLVKVLHDIFPRGVKIGLYFGTPIQAWLANNYKNASDCMWDGNPEKAKKWMQSGKDVACTKKSHTSKDMTEVLGEKKHVGERFVAKALNAEYSNWGKCK